LQVHCGAQGPDICCEMPETSSGAEAPGSGDPAQGTQAMDSPESPTLAIVLEQIRTLWSELAELCRDVARVETREDVLKQELSEAVTGRKVAELRNEVKRAKVTELSLRNELSQKPARVQRRKRRPRRVCFTVKLLRRFIWPKRPLLRSKRRLQTRSLSQ
jgi:uncharacterized membrane protein YccC